MEHAPELALEWHRAGRKVVLATVIETWGSAPRRTGAQLVIDGDGAMEGSVSGGCVEGAVVYEAMDAMGSGESRVLEFGVSDDEAFAVGLACGGTIRILLEPVGGAMPVAVLEALVGARSARTPVAYVAGLSGRAPRLANLPEFETRFAKDRSGVEEDGETFVAIHNPPLRMAIVGAVHIAQHLVPMAKACGFDPVIIDPRPAFGSAERFPGETILEDWPDDALETFCLDSRSALVTLTHDTKLDDPALQVGLRSDAFYIGCLGSTRTHGKRVARLSEAGFSEADIARLNAPIGLNIGGANPAEIAVSIMAQVIEKLRT